MSIFKSYDDRVVIFGQSCVGKTTFAKTMSQHTYYCFDYLFQWHLIETLGLSISSNLRHIKQIVNDEKFVIDGWHLADKEGQFLPDHSCVYVVWAPYEKIISQYRIPVADKAEHHQMYRKWYYEIDYDKFPSVRYFWNTGQFIEMTKAEFTTSLEHNR